MVNTTVALSLGRAPPPRPLPDSRFGPIETAGKLAETLATVFVVERGGPPAWISSSCSNRLKTRSRNTRRSETERPDRSARYPLQPHPESPAPGPTLARGAPAGVSSSRLVSATRPPPPVDLLPWRPAHPVFSRIMVFLCVTALVSGSWA